MNDLGYFSLVFSQNFLDTFSGFLGHTSVLDTHSVSMFNEPCVDHHLDIGEDIFGSLVSFLFENNVHDTGSCRSHDLLAELASEKLSVLYQYHFVSDRCEISHAIVSHGLPADYVDVWQQNRDYLFACPEGLGLDDRWCG